MKKIFYLDELKFIYILVVISKTNIQNMEMTICMFCIGYWCLTSLEGVFAVGTTDKICGQSLSSKIPIDMNSIILKLYVT